jgi:hypothetical protein
LIDSFSRKSKNPIVLGYFLLVLIILYAYFGTLISDLFFKPNHHKNQEEIQVNVLDNNTITDSREPKIRKEYKFMKTITSTEIIIILWFTIIYGSCLLLFLRFKVLKLERDPNSEKRKKNNKDDDYNEFINKSRNSKNSFKNKNLTQVTTINDNNSDRNIPFWEK